MIVLYITLVLLSLFCLFLIIRIKKLKASTISNNATDEKLVMQNAALKQELEFMIAHFTESELLARLVRQSPNAIMMMDREGNILSVNEGFNNMYEYSFREFTRALGTNYRQTSFSPDVQHRIDSIFSTKRPYRYEALNITKTGKELWTQTALVPILDEDGNVTNMVTIDTDIHQRVTQSDKLITEMESLNERIDQLSKEFQFMENEFKHLFTNINELYRLIEKTDQILNFIKEISSETRLLGFNASIEANRAGEHGAGFRVITSKIIEISKSTIESIAEINDILKSISTKQNELISKKDTSEERMATYIGIIDSLKKEVRAIERSIAEFKSLA